ncbi:hypothetical protein GALMADRAFT_227265 [Galerina marginata CBS 339.88]|uniref:Uncharacterized protein n=1 Tax=Galerina marginata (strain CBS 339.88) TaxID=685588 RepID=A0A067T4T3_GALM3|nr:hypothetical protein GALMADRAFT_227265 [Galerina marginata CBS 339.88]
MFAFFSRIRLPSSGPQPQDDGDDTSSLGRSLNLPWPVTESSTRRPATTTTTTPARRDWATGPPSQGSGSGISISYPIPRTAPNSLTGIDDFPMPPSGPPYADAVMGHFGHGRSTRAGLAQPAAAAPGLWYEHEKPRSLHPRPQPAPSQSLVPYAPPQVVRLESGAFAGDDGSDEENEDEGAPSSSSPRYPYEYTSHPSASSYALPYPYPETQLPDVHSTAQHFSSSRVDVTEYDNGNEAELYSSPFDDPLEVVPAAPRSTTSSSSSTSKSGNAPMTKSRWNLKLKMHPHTGPQNTSHLPSGAGPSRANPIHILDEQYPRQAYPHPPASQGSSGHLVESGQHPPSVSVDTDVYNNAYNYPLIKQLSPIQEQDYSSPAAESRSLSLRFGDGKPSPGGDSLVGSVLGAAGVGRKGLENGADVAERESLKTRPASVRTGSVGSVATVNGNGHSLSRTGSMSMSVGAPAQTGGSQDLSTGSEITRPSIHAAPFVSRRLNRTVSQTSSKSDSQSQGHPPSQAQVQTPTTQLPSGSVVRTPISAGTATTPTGTMFTPTSTLQTPIAQTPTSTAGAVVSGPAIQPPPPALLAGSLPTQGVSSGLPKIPSLPIIAPLDLRFSYHGPTGLRTSTEVQKENATKPSRNGKGLGKVERMPIIDGSVEGYYEEEVEVEEDDDEGDDDDDVGDVDEEEDEDEEYDHESLHADSFVTAGTNDDEEAKHNVDPENGVELASLRKHSRTALPNASTSTIHSVIPSASPSRSGSARSLPAITFDRGVTGPPTAPGSMTGDSFIHRRWERDAALGFGAISSSPTTFRAKGQNSRWPFRLFSSSSPSQSSSATFTPAFWAFWIGFLFPVLWLVGGWHFTNAGELPPKSTPWEWYFWNSRWSAGGFRALMERVLGCCLRRKSAQTDSLKDGTVRGRQDGTPGLDQAQRRKGKRRSVSQSKARIGKVYPALPRWVAERQSTDDGRMRLNDPKRSLRGISFGYPFISRPPGSQDSSGAFNPSSNGASSSAFARIMSRVVAILAKPNRVLDLMYGVKLKEVRGRPESGRRMFDPWIQRCRYALCYGLLLLAVGLCTASAYLIVVNTKKLL